MPHAWPQRPVASHLHRSGWTLWTGSKAPPDLSHPSSRCLPPVLADERRCAPLFAVPHALPTNCQCPAGILPRRARIRQPQRGVLFAPGRSLGRVTGRCHGSRRAARRRRPSRSRSTRSTWRDGPCSTRCNLNPRSCNRTRSTARYDRAAACVRRHVGLACLAAVSHGNSPSWRSLLKLKLEESGRHNSP